MNINTQQLITTDIYDLGLSNKLNIPLENMVIMDSPSYSNLSDLLIKNNHIKSLVYNYLNAIDKKVSLSRIIDLFAQTDNINFFKSEKFIEYMKTDEVYHSVISSSITNPFKWCNLLNEVCGYIFDSNHLRDKKHRDLMGVHLNLFQCVYTSFHYCVDASKIKYDSNKSAGINLFYNTKRKVEKSFYDEVIKNKKSNDIKIDFAHDTFTFLSTNTGEILYMVFDKYQNISFELLYKDKPRDRKITEDDINKIICFINDNQQIKEIYECLRSIKSEKLIKKYFIDYEKLKTFSIYKDILSITDTIIDDLLNQTIGSAVTKELFVIKLGLNSCNSECISFNPKRKMISIGRTIYFGKESTRFKRHRYTVKDSEYNSITIAERLVLNGLIFFSMNDLNSKNIMDCKPLIDGLDSNFSGLFMRVPMENLKELVKGCQDIQRNILNDLSKHSDLYKLDFEQIVKESEIVEDFIKTKPTSYLEFNEFKKDREAYINKNGLVNSEHKEKLISKFLKKYEIQH